MTKPTIPILVAVSAIAGALCTQALSSPRAAAQADRQWRECFIANVDGLADGDSREEMARGEGKIAVPSGWTPVGGNAINNRYGGVVLCR